MDWKKIRQEYESTEISLSDLAVKHGIKYSTMKSRNQREKWAKGASTKDASKNKKDASKDASKKTQDASSDTKSKREPKIRIVVNNREIDFEENTDLTEKQRLFCLYYIKSYNATMSAIKAGYAKSSAHVEGHRFLRNPKIAKEIRRLKGKAHQELFIDALDVLEVYAKIAFANIAEYTDFGQRDVPVMNMFGPVYEGKGKDKKAVLKTVNFVDIKPSAEIDGTLISEVKQGKDGVSIKLHDKMKALEKLELYLDLLPDKHKRKIEEEKLKLDQAKFDLDKKKTDDPDEDVEDDGFMDALAGKTEEVWNDTEDVSNDHGGEDDGT